jgi:hypothetical protein
MAEPSLEGCREKARRGKAYLRELTGLMDKYVAAPIPHKVVVRFDKPRKALVFTGEIVRPMKDALLWGCLLGDGIHNLRSALDHLVWQLVALDTGKEPSTDNQFPICDSGGAYWSIGRKGQPSTRDFRLRGLSADHLAVIDSCQPYRSYTPGKQHPLSALRELSNHDKHRLVHTTLFAISLKGVTLQPNADAGEQIGEPEIKPFSEDGPVEVLVLHYTAPGDNPEIEITGLPLVEIGFQPYGIRAVELPVIVNAVEEVIESFRDDF